MGEQQPTFSIIIPTYQRPEKLSVCLQALRRLDYPRDRFEVIVVDDGSTTALETVVAPCCEQLVVTLLRQSNAGPATARNTGVAYAKGQFLAFTDDDCSPAPNWLRTLAARFAVTPTDAIAGQTLNALPDNPYATASQLLVSFLFTYHSVGLNQVYFWTTNNLALSADTFRALGGFDPSFPLAGGEDWELCRRWVAQGYGIRYAPEVVVHHAHWLDWQMFWRQHFYYGRGAFRARRMSTQYSQEHRRQPLFFFHRQLLRYLFSLAPDRRGVRLAVLLALTQLASTSGFFWEWRRQSR